MPMEPKKPKLSRKHAAIGVVVAAVAGVVIAVVANAGRVCAQMQNPIGRAVCETLVETAQDAQGEPTKLPDGGVLDEAGANGL